MLYIRPSESPEEKKVPCHRLWLFNSMTLRIYELKDAALLVRLQHVLKSVKDEQTSCFVDTCLFVKMWLHYAREEKIFSLQEYHIRGI